MDSLARKLLKELQENFPIDSAPFARIAERLGVSEGDVIKGVKELEQEGVISGIGTVFDSKKLGHYTMLVAMKVPDAKIGKVARFVADYPEVHQTASRSHDFNLWFSITAPSRDRVKQILEEIEKGTGVEDIFPLPIVREFVQQEVPA